MRALTRELAREVGDQVVTVEIPSVDVVAYVRVIKAAPVARWHKMEPTQANAELVALAVCTETGEPLFAPEDLEEAWREVAAWPAPLFLPIFHEALSLNALDRDDKANAGN
jgi:hypothetical protein